MPRRRKAWKTEWFRQGQYKGYRRDDVADANWAIGYTLPPLFEKRGAPLRDLAINAISKKRLNIEQLPDELQWAVNRFHMVYAVGVITDIRYFCTSCWRHQDEHSWKCRQCRMRRETLELYMQRGKGIAESEGLLVRQWWYKQDVKRDIEMAMSVLRLSVRRIEDSDEDLRMDSGWGGLDISDPSEEQWDEPRGIRVKGRESMKVEYRWPYVKVLEPPDWSLLPDLETRVASLDGIKEEQTEVNDSIEELWDDPRGIRKTEVKEPIEELWDDHHGIRRQEGVETEVGRDWLPEEILEPLENPGEWRKNPPEAPREGEQEEEEGAVGYSVPRTGGAPVAAGGSKEEYLLRL